MIFDLTMSKMIALMVRRRLPTDVAEVLAAIIELCREVVNDIVVCSSSSMEKATVMPLLNRTLLLQQRIFMPINQKRQKVKKVQASTSRRK